MMRTCGDGGDDDGGERDSLTTTTSASKQATGRFLSPTSRGRLFDHDDALCFFRHAPSVLVVVAAARRHCSPPPLLCRHRRCRRRRHDARARATQRLKA